MQYILVHYQMQVLYLSNQTEIFMNAQTAKDMTDKARFHKGDWLHVESRIEEAASKGLNSLTVEGGMHESQVKYLEDKGFRVSHSSWTGKVYAVVFW
jgi:hypothetical protein